MPITAKLRYLRISPRKVRLVTDLIKGLTVEKAERQLRFLTKKAARPILKLLNSAVANAQNDANLTKENLKVAKVIVGSGPVLKRWRARAMGRAAPIMKRTSHITLILNEKESVLSREDKKIKREPTEEKIKPSVEEKAVKEKKETDILEEIRQPVQKTREEEKIVQKPKPVPPARPYPTTPQAKKRFFSRQTFGNVKKYFRRKSI